MAELVRVRQEGRALLLTSILDYANATKHSRCYEEADLLLQAGHLFLCGRTSSSEDKVTIFALCLATSSVRGDPHEISVELVAGDGLKFRVQRAVCSCVAGTSECCKHAIAVLLYCNRTGIQHLEELSSTDKECTWRRTPGKELYGEPVPVKDFCHVKTQPAFPEPSPEEQREIQHQLMGASFNSALAKHRRRRRAERSCSAPEPPRLDDRYRQVIERSEGNVLLARLAEIPTSPSEVCSAFYNKEVVVSVETAATLLHDTENNKAAWMMERSDCLRAASDSLYQGGTRDVRVAGLISLPYGKVRHLCPAVGQLSWGAARQADWERKVRSTMQPSFRGNAATAYGQRCEPKAREKYVTTNNGDVFTCGLVVCPKNPWLGCSPDGVVFEDGRPAKLLEIKCPTKGQTMTAKALLATCDFLEKNEAGTYTLKKRHTHYAQSGAKVCGARERVPKCIAAPSDGAPPH
ncbi:hypothetical protein HPB47_027905 [Ixodes persulcatus]|uniref:Uncharacterized protein n=1 Tax=Ixodes persulcatus TaxID=34615 RepID=A0AC60PV76_IXOPE|nr:hypothetical protein HPB47_027905 [Ixodes persulcatus]